MVLSGKLTPVSNTSNVYVSADSNLIDPSHTVKDLDVIVRRTKPSMYDQE